MPKYGVDNQDRSNISAERPFRERSKDSASTPGDKFKGEGDVLSGRFELIKCVGAGGMSTVYQALDRRKLKSDDGDPYVAVKILNRTFPPHQHWLDASQQEAQECQLLVHPNIVRVYDFYRDGSAVYMTMEYLRGELLTCRTRSAGFTGIPIGQALGIINAMGKALSFAHTCGIVHCDFKPANVFLTTAGEVKLIDFGIARMFSHAEGIGADSGFEPKTLYAVTPAYASPDMLERREPDPRDDVYALACTTYELLTGVHPFYGMQATEAQDVGLKVVRRIGLSRRRWKALQRALAFDRAERTPSVTRFLEELNTGNRRIAVAAGIATVTVAAGVYLYHPEFTQRDGLAIGTQTLSQRSTGGGLLSADHKDDSGRFSAVPAAPGRVEEAQSPVQETLLVPQKVKRHDDKGPIPLAPQLQPQHPILSTDEASAAQAAQWSPSDKSTLSVLKNTVTQGAGEDPGPASETERPDTSVDPEDSSLKQALRELKEARFGEENGKFHEFLDRIKWTHGQ